jgi:hypothetical protein
MLSISLHKKRLNTLKTLILLLFSTPIISMEYIIGVEELNYYPLFNFSTNKIQKPSFTLDLLSAFFNEKKYQYRFVTLPIKRFDKWYVEKVIDFKFPDNVRWRDEQKNKLNITFSQPIIKLLAGSYVLNKNQTYQRSDIKKLGTILGFSSTLWFDKIKEKQLIVIEDTSPLSVVKHVLHGNTDATNIDQNVINYNLKLINKAGEITLNKNIPYEIYTYHFSSIKHPNVIREFDLFIKNNQALINKLKIKYQITEVL